MRKSKFSKVLDYLIDYKTSRRLLAMKNNGYLVETGWLQSLKKKQPLNANEEPIPWVTYSFLRFTEKYFTKNQDLFEFGSGNSTFYYSKKVNSVITVEHDLNWYSRLVKDLPGNVTLLHKELDESYEDAIVKSGLLFDIVVIDGRRRVNCIQKSINSLKTGGIIVLDDSERERYEHGIQFLLLNGFKRIDFWGISPGYFQDKCTTIFFRELKL